MFASLSLGLALLPAVFATVYDVDVGGSNGTLVFVPEIVNAMPGDQVVFHFNPKNHTVSQSSFAAPCSLKDGGFTSGFMPVAANVSADSRPTYTVQVNDTAPIWIYCAQAKNTPASHCGKGMIMAINCPKSGPNTFDTFKKSALDIGAGLVAAASSASAAAVSAPATAVASATSTADYSYTTLPPVVPQSVVTVPITLDTTSVWTTTYTSLQNSPAATPVAAAGAVHTVIVGGTGPNGPNLFFTPNNITASPRDTIVFQFQQKNHTVTQSSFADPCHRLNANNASAPLGLASGFMPVATGATDFPTWNVTVNSTNPLWFYCGQVGHCAAGMVFSVNAVEPRDFSAFQTIAKSFKTNVSSAAAVSAAAPSGSAASTTGGAVSVRVGGGVAALAVFAVSALLL